MPRGPRRTSRFVVAFVLTSGLLASTSCGADGSSPGPSAATAAAETADCAPGRPADPTDKPSVIVSGGHQRSYLLHLPADYDGQHAYPLVLNLHGHGGSAAEHEANTLLGTQGAGRGFVVVTPDALGKPQRWNFDRRPGGADDYTFITDLLDDVTGRLCIDPDRRYVAGSSNGAALAGFLACAEPYWFAAVAMVIATAPPTCPAGVAPAVITIRGTADLTVPYGNTPDMVADYAETYHCSFPPSTEEPATGVERTRYQDCDDGAEVVLDTVVGGVHAWPGGTRADKPGNSQAGIEFSATDEIVAFFANP